MILNFSQKKEQKKITIVNMNENQNKRAFRIYELFDLEIKY